MATLDSLAGDQRAVLQLILRRGRGYAEIGNLLSISPGTVRERALTALDALGPSTGAGDDARATVGDYLLGQLDEGDAEDARALLALSSPVRAWAQAVATEIAPLASASLPEIPEAGAAPLDGPAAADGRSSPPADPTPHDGAAATADPPTPADRPPSSRRGGMVVIGLAVIAVVAVVLVLLLDHHPHHSSGASLADSSGTTSTTSSTTSSTATTSTAKARPIAQVNLTSPTAGSKAVAVAEVVAQGSTRVIAIIGEHIPPNTKHTSYEVWLYNSSGSFEKLGFVSPAVGKSGRFSDETGLPANAGRYHSLIVTTESSGTPTSPGPILLRGTLKLS